MKNKSCKKLNNQGSTFVLALVIITLVTTLALTIMAASLHNFTMKSVDRNSKDTFYTAESVLDEVRAGVGLNAINNLGDAYANVLTNIVKTESSGFSNIIDNETANIKFKDSFIDEMLEDVTNKKAKFESDQKEVYVTDPAALTEVVKYLRKNIVGYEEGMATITSVGGVKAYKESTTGLQWVLIIEDVASAYKDKKSGEMYFSDITADLEIEFPNMNVDFSNTNNLNDFTNYALIADTNINVTGVDALSNGSVYAGNQISVNSSGVVPGKFTLSSLIAGENINVICGGDNGANSGTIKVTGSADVKSELAFQGANIWCTNLTTGKYLQGSDDQSKGANITIGNLCKTYIKDDLTSEGQYTTMDVNGEYYGYSYAGTSSLIHDSSSAIIINGQSTSLTIGTSKMILGGHAYVELSEADSYMTGESLAFKGNQDIYLMPTKYLAVGDENTVTNPMPWDTWNNLVTSTDPNVKACDPTNFFAYVNGYLCKPESGKEPYVVKRVGDRVYIYLNFVSKDAAAQYIKDIASLENGAHQHQELGFLLDTYTAGLFAGSAVTIKEDSKSQIYTKGALLVTDGKTANTLNGVTPSAPGEDVSSANSKLELPSDEFVLTSLDLENRYKILTHLLVDIPWVDDANGGDRYIVNDIDSALWQKRDYLIAGSEMTTDNIFNNIVDRDMLSSKEYNATGAYTQYTSDESKNYIKIAVNRDYTVPSNCHGGVIVATGNVTINHDFEGLILAGGSIIVNGNAIFKSNQAMVELLITNEFAFKDSEDLEMEVPFKEYFHAYKYAATEDDSREEVKVETVDYKDIVNYNNWRKYKDETIESTSE